MASNRHVLVLGGNGKISRLLTVILLKKSWTVTSLIRNPDQIDDLKKISEGLPGIHKIVVHDLIKVDSQEKAAAVLDQVKPDSVVFSAGPGRGTDQDTIIRIDRDAAIFFIQASVANKSISHHLQVSYLGARREQAPWWTPEDWEGWKKVNSTFLGPYYEPKTAADEALVTEASKRSGLTAVSVRPGGLTDRDKGGVLLGKTKQARGMTARASTARVMALVLDKEGVKGHWLDVLDGEEDTETAVDRYVRDETECAEGEPVMRN
ncbi:nad dependent epimerase dehydratase family protein [Fusarium austroafricanum]|uniref:Nad dependent epimerase dehydratase family protein n=1 Tax=Fusarium austroafricanum TaxID=2364996 RepID=A0A8H4KEX4_9HYPO|nr:nad dependent epimerase dehydratase family protein [Fusarium austroafricanum]